MKTLTRTLIASLAVAGVLGALAVPVVAGPGRGGGGPCAGMSGGGPGMMGGWVTPAERLGVLEKTLALTEAQKPAWDAYTAALTAHWDEMAKMRTSVDPRAVMNLPPEERYAQMSAFQKQRFESRDKMMAAQAKLASVLTVEQRILLDQGFGPGSGRGRR